jgi:hypothetical protein
MLASSDFNGRHVSVAAVVNPKAVAACRRPARPASIADARTTAENHSWGNALVRRARSVDLLRGLSLQPFGRGQRRPMAG